MHGCGGHAWLQGACVVVGGMVVGGMHGCRGVCVVGGVGGMHGCGGCVWLWGSMCGCGGHA